jgi:translation initiation factor 2 beta subunit (eIF-2beta)/eIF-5
MKTKDHSSNHDRGEAVLATCFCCKKKFKVGKNQHAKYSICPVCKKYKEEFERGEFWVDCALLLPKRGFSRKD